MANLLDDMGPGKRWHLMVSAAKRALEAQGYALSRVPGRGLSNIWNIQKGSTHKLAAIRTTRDRWFAFPTLEQGAKWKTLDDVDLVVVAAVDVWDNPQSIQVYSFEAPEVRRRFDAAYAARVQANTRPTDKFGMWVKLDDDDRGLPSSVGCGLAKDFPQIAAYPITALMAGAPDEEIASAQQVVDEDIETPTAPPVTIGEVLARAREQVAAIAGVRVEAVRLDLKIEY